MSSPGSRKWLFVLLGGDGLALLAVTLIGFAVHERSLAGWRWLSTFLPLAIAWAGIALPLGLYQYETTRQPLQIWRVFLAAVYAGPLAGLLRTLWVPGTVIPVFVLVLIAMTAAGMGVWRLALAFLIRKRI